MFPSLREEHDSYKDIMAKVRAKALEEAEEIVRGSFDGRYRYWKFWPEGNRTEEDEISLFATDAADAVLALITAPEHLKSSPLPERSEHIKSSPDGAGMREALEELVGALNEATDALDIEAAMCSTRLSKARDVADALLAKAQP